MPSGAAARPRARSSSQVRSRPGVIGTSAPSRSSTITCSTDGDSATASSAAGFISAWLPRRSPPSAVMIAFAFASCSRAATADGAKPGEDRHVERAELRDRVGGDHRLGDHRHEHRDRVALADAERAQARRDRVDLALQLGVGERAHLAVLALGRSPRPGRRGRPAACRSTQLCVRFTWPPTNHFDQGIPPELSSTRS